MSIQEFNVSHGNSVWTDARIVELKHRRFTLKESCGYIGKAMGISRGAVIGKISRLGLSQKRPEGAAKPVPRVSLRPRGRPRKERTTAVLIQFAPSPEPTEATDILVDFIPPNPVTFAQLEDHHCRFPVGDSPFMFCGEIPKQDRPYCTAHCMVAYVPSAPRKPWVPGRVDG